MTDSRYMEVQHIETEPGRKRDHKQRNDRYLYISGLVRALELKLLDRAQMNRLFEARQMEDVDRVLSEAGYPAGDGPEERLRAESIAILEWFMKMMPQSDYADVFLAFNDAHNLKLVLKKLLAIWIAGSRDDHPDMMQEKNEEKSLLPDFMGIDGLPPIGTDVRHALLPAAVEPAVLYRQIAQHQPEGLPEWIYQAAVEAVRRYLIRYELSDIDLYLDQVAWREAHHLAKMTDNVFFCDYLQIKTDLINLDMLIRARNLRMGSDILKKALLPGGLIAEKEILPLYDQDEESILLIYRHTPYSTLVQLAQPDTKTGDKAEIGRMSDNILMEKIREARQITSGPEIPLAFVLARQLEIKNIRVVLTCLRNGLPPARARELVRDSYLPWR